MVRPTRPWSFGKTLEIITFLVVLNTNQAMARSGRAIPIVLPDEVHTRLEIQQEGLEALRGIEGLIAPVVVIGPFRSGKSFVLNQMLDLPCNEGFTVGHQRHAQTKGVWLWSEPQRISGDDSNGTSQSVHVIYVDTEGFEAAGKADVYDDRVFALSALLSTVLIYNLPETVKEADIQKLQFALELAEEFKHRANGRGQESPQADIGGEDPGQGEARFEIPALLWLIQRDFLQGRSVEQMVSDALEPVANPNGDANVNHLNDIRNHLRTATRNYAALGMCQPHLDRTKLCELASDDLDPRYVKQREDLKSLVVQLVEKTLQLTRLQTGPSLADHLSKLVAALNAGEIPSVRSVTETFNEDIVKRMVVSYERESKKIRLPVEEDVLRGFHYSLKKRFIDAFLKEKFGRDENTEAIDTRIEQVFTWLADRNRLSSKETCEAFHMRCTDLLDMLQLMALPSQLRFDNLFQSQCNTTFESECVGPSKASYRQRIQKDYTKERTRFIEAYNQKLLNGVTMASLLGVVIFRFIWIVPLFELFAWAGFLFLEMYLKTTSLFTTEHSHPYWKKFVAMWEAAIFNQIYDLNSFVHILGPLLAIAVVIKSGQRCWEGARHYACFRFLMRALSCIIYGAIIYPLRSITSVLLRCVGRDPETTDCYCFRTQTRRGVILPISYKQS